MGWSGWKDWSENVLQACWRQTGKIINRSVIRSATEPETANLRVDPVKPLPPDPHDILDEMMSTTDFGTPLSSVDPVDSIPANTKSRTWQEIEQGNYEEHHKDVQQRYFQSEQPKSMDAPQQQYPTRSKTSANKATTAPEEKEFVFLRDKGEKITPVFEQFEFILRDKLGEPRLDKKGKEIVVIGPSPNAITGRYSEPSLMKEEIWPEPV